MTTRPMLHDPVQRGLAFVGGKPSDMPSDVRHAVRQQLGGADERRLIDETLEDLTAALPAYASRGLTPDAARSLPFFARHLRDMKQTRATDPAYHAHLLDQADAMLALLADLDAFVAERRAAGDDPTEAILRLLGAVRATWGGVPDAMKNAPPMRTVRAVACGERGEWEVSVDYNPPPPTIPATLREFVAAHRAHAARLREPARTPQMDASRRAAGRQRYPHTPVRAPAEPTKAESLTYIAENWLSKPGLRYTRQMLFDAIQRGDFAATWMTPRRIALDFAEVLAHNPEVDEEDMEADPEGQRRPRPRGV